jgi:hypothetical protein
MPPAVTIFKESDHLAMHAADLITKSAPSSAVVNGSREVQQDATQVMISNGEEGFANAVEWSIRPAANTSGARA